MSGFGFDSRPGAAITLPISPENGGTGTGTVFTAGSVVFASTLGSYKEDNANFFFNDSTDRLGIGTNAPSARLDVTRNSLGTGQTVSSGIALVNTTAAASGAQQISPARIMIGQGWKSNATAASQSVAFRDYVVPVQGTVNPTGYWIMEASINGGSFGSGVLGVNSAGNVYAPGNMVVGVSVNSAIAGGINLYVQGAGYFGSGAGFGTTPSSTAHGFYAAGTTSKVPIQLTAGVAYTSALVAGMMEFFPVAGANVLTFVRAGTTREAVLTGNLFTGETNTVDLTRSIHVIDLATGATLRIPVCQ